MIICHQNIIILVTFWLNIEVILSTDASELPVEYSCDDLRIDEVTPDVILLADSGGSVHEPYRSRRDVADVTQKTPNLTLVSASLTTEDEATTVDDNSLRSRSTVSDTTPTDLNRGYAQSSEDFLKDVDIGDQTIKKTIESKNLSYSNDNGTTKYYKTNFVSDGVRFFQNLDDVNKTGPHRGKVEEHSMLSKSYRRAATINLKFRFPFYGHEVENITIATGGFLYTGDYVHSWLAATQYIAPLMANFDTSNNQKAKIRYLDTGDSLIVEWKDVYLQKREHEGLFTFQVILNSTGDIQFAYNKVPLNITTIHDEEHPVKVGLSDAYIIDRTIFFVRRKTIYEYHRVNMKNENISSHSAIVFKALFTCNQQKTCTDCLYARSGPHSIECGWCPVLSKCSDGMDRNRQDWLTNNCDKNSISDLNACSATTPAETESSKAPEFSGEHAARSADTPRISTGSTAVSPGGLTAIIIVVLTVVLIFGWTGYAYFYPHTWSGQLLIKYRPGAWRWRQGGARYTAASIHM